MPRILRSFALALVVMVVLGPSAGADRQWCRVDPVVAINGKAVNIVVLGHPDVPAPITGQTEVVIAVPVGATTELLGADNGFGDAVSFVESPDPAIRNARTRFEVRAFVPAPGAALPIEVEVFAADTDDRLGHGRGTYDARNSTRAAV